MPCFSFQRRNTPLYQRGLSVLCCFFPLAQTLPSLRGVSRFSGTGCVEALTAATRLLSSLQRIDSSPVDSLMSFNPLVYRPQYPSYIALHLNVIKSQEMNPDPFQSLLPLHVLFEAPGVTLTVNFNCQHESRAVEIHDVVFNRLLSVEVIALQLFPFQFVPQENLR